MPGFGDEEDCDDFSQQFQGIGSQVALGIKGWTQEPRELAWPLL